MLKIQQKVLAQNLKKQEVPLVLGFFVVFFFQFLGPKYFLCSLLFDDGILLGEAKNGKKRCLMLNLSILNGPGATVVRGRVVEREGVVHVMFHFLTR